LRSIYLPHWRERYGHYRKTFSTAILQKDHEELARLFGVDGFYLLKALSGPDEQELSDIPEVANLKIVLEEQYKRVEGVVAWRKVACSGCALKDYFRRSNIQD
jgi:hypothetical protein